jgi:hypothetical protein
LPPNFAEQGLYIYYLCRQWKEEDFEFNVLQRLWNEKKLDFKPIAPKAVGRR